MNSGFRGWLFRAVAFVFGWVAIAVFLSLAEISRFYGFPQLQPSAGIGLAVAFLLLAAACLGVWTWKRYTVVSIMGGFLLTLGYLAFRPEMVRDDVLKQLISPPLTIDLVGYRAIALRNDPERELKIERLRLLYSLLKTYGNPAAVPQPEPTPAPQ